MKVSAEPIPLHIDLDSEEASYLLWILENGLPDNRYNRIQVIRDHLADGLRKAGVEIAR